MSRTPISLIEESIAPARKGTESVLTGMLIARIFVTITEMV